jgi:hypothetical protein
MYLTRIGGCTVNFTSTNYSIDKIIGITPITTSKMGSNCPKIDSFSKKSPMNPHMNKASTL